MTTSKCTQNKLSKKFIYVFTYNFAITGTSTRKFTFLESDNKISIGAQPISRKKISTFCELKLKIGGSKYQKPLGVNFCPKMPK